MNNLSEKEIAEFREIFNLVDADGSGQISHEEFRKLLETLNLRPTEDELVEMFDEVDGDGNGTIEFEEFVSVMSKRVQSEYSPEQLRNAFKLFETDGLPAGCVSTEVLEHALVTYGSVKLTKEEAALLLASVDPEGRGHFNYLDFVSLVTDR